MPGTPGSGSSPLEPGRPFFLFVHTYDVALPLQPPPALPPALRPRVLGAAPVRGNVREETTSTTLDLTAEEQEHVEVHYDAGVRRVDDALGDFLDWLESTGRLRDTAVIVTSDHGESLGERSFVGHGELYDNQLHVPS